MTGPYLSENVQELEVVLDAIRRGSKRSALRTLVVVCPWKSHTLLEVFPSNGAQVLLSLMWLRAMPGDAFHHDLKVSGSNITIDGTAITGTETIAAAATLGDSPKTWWVRCCGVAGIETKWVEQQIKATTRRAVVPESQFLRDTV